MISENKEYEKEKRRFFGNLTYNQQIDFISLLKKENIKKTDVNITILKINLIFFIFIFSILSICLLLKLGE